MDNREKSEIYVCYTVLLIPIVVFILMPAYPSGSFSFALDALINSTIFANGYYQPGNYPFAAKAANAVSVVPTVIAEVVMGVWRRNAVNESKLKKVWWFFFVIIVLGYHLIKISIYPQEYGKGRLISEAAYNNPVFL